MPDLPQEFVRYSVSLVRQGKHKFYTLTMRSDILARTCFVSTRFDDPQEGFQRVLDKTRAQQIADYTLTDLAHGSHIARNALTSRDFLITRKTGCLTRCQSISRHMGTRIC